MTLLPDGTAPIFLFTTDEASPSGIAYEQGSPWIATLRGQGLWQLSLDGGQPAGEPIAHFEVKFGRLRMVEVAPDDALWILTCETDGF
ncbi:MAG: PQQ-dependent sugar dehydrogenase [Hyphomicrobiales bacterium]